MNSDQEKHLDDIKMNFCEEVDVKYQAGQQEHGGSLWKKSGIIKNIRQETLDFVVYTDVLKQQLYYLEALLETENYSEALKWLRALLSEEMEEVIIFEKPK